MFFYLPGEIAAPRGGRSVVVEATSPEKIAQFTGDTRPKVILTDAKREPLVSGHADIRVVFRSGQWTVFQIH